MKKITFILLFLLIFQPALADDKSEAEHMLKTSVNSVLSILGEKNAPTTQKRDKIVEIITEVFDVSLMAKLCLGKKHWTGLNTKQKKEFTHLFVKHFKDSYSDKLELFENEKVVFEPLVKEKKKARIQTYVLSKGKKYSILYKMYTSPKGWKIYDVEIEGVSLIQTYRSQYRQFLAKATVDDLMKKLKEKKQPE